jgi:predicted extracellular nuclease
VQNRIAAAKVVQQVVDQRMAKNPSNHVMVIGDFNVVDTDVPNPIKTVLQAPKAANPLADARDLYNNHPNVTQSEKEQMPKGSYFYIKNMQWNTLDKILLTQNLIDGKGVELIQESFRTHAPESLTRLFRYNERHQGPRPTLRIPWRYDILATQEDEAGFSDHFAIYVRLRLQ